MCVCVGTVWLQKCISLCSMRTVWLRPSTSWSRAFWESCLWIHSAWLCQATALEEISLQRSHSRYTQTHTHTRVYRDTNTLSLSLQISVDDSVSVKFSVQALIYPVLQGLDLNTPSHQQNHNIPMLHRFMMARYTHVHVHTHRRTQSHTHLC